jgi:hypothetical protein
MLVTYRWDVELPRSMTGENRKGTDVSVHQGDISNTQSAVKPHPGASNSNCMWAR